MRRYHPKLPWHSLGTHSRATPRTLSATPRTRTRLATHSHSLGHATHSHSHHLLQQPKGSLTLPALLTCTGVFTEARNIRCQQLVHHLLQQPEGYLPVLALLTRTDGCTEARNIRCQLVHHLLQQCTPSHCLPFSPSLMDALKLTTFDVSNWCTISCSNPGAPSHCLPFSHALMEASKLTTSSVSS